MLLREQAVFQREREAGDQLAWLTVKRHSAVFCDYYNKEEECVWHYKACGTCLKTCRNPEGLCLADDPRVEGCYPDCPKDKPFYEEVTMKCLNQCGCYDNVGKYYNPGDHVTSCNSCETCKCLPRGIACNYNISACYCEYNGMMFSYNETISKEYIGNGECLTLICGINGTITRSVQPCITPQTQTTIKVSTTVTTTKESPTTLVTSTPTTVRKSTVTTKCFCHSPGGQLILPGETIYVRTDENGCAVAVVCARICSDATVPFCGTEPLKILDEKNCCYFYDCPACTADDGSMRTAGTTWIEECKNCTCDPNTLMITCNHVICDNTKPTCDLPGYELIQVVIADDPCCPEYQCRCNPLLCSAPNTTCSAGYNTNIIISGCCYNVNCDPKNVCLQNGIEYMLGSPVPSLNGACYKCTCTSEEDPQTKLKQVNCQLITCNEDCSLDEEYQVSVGQCCGTCVPKGCKIITATGEQHLLTAGELWVPDYDACTTYNCTISQGQFSTIVSKNTCEFVDSRSCAPGEDFILNTGVCCGECVQTSCMITMNGETLLLEVGQTKSQSNDNCTSYECIKSEGNIYPIITRTTCNNISESNCENGEIVISPDGCCPICKAPKHCNRLFKTETISIGECNREVTLELAYCVGACPSSSKYLPSSDKMDKTCECCMEQSVSLRKLVVECLDKSQFIHPYEYVDSCGCELCHSNEIVS